MSLTIIFSIIIVHWIADFVFQTEWMALNKSKENSALGWHAFVYSAIFFIAGVIYGEMYMGEDRRPIVYFALVTFVLHFLTDYITSRITSRQFRDKIYYQIPPKLGAFAVIGLDQVIHYVSLILAFKYFLL